MDDLEKLQEKLIEYRVKELQNIRKAYEKLNSARKEIISKDSDIAVKRLVKSNTFKSLANM